MVLAKVIPIIIVITIIITIIIVITIIIIIIIIITTTMIIITTRSWNNKNYKFLLNYKIKNHKKLWQNSKVNKLKN
jgi:hypothetical protein